MKSFVEIVSNPYFDKVWVFLVERKSIPYQKFALTPWGKDFI